MWLHHGDADLSWILTMRTWEAKWIVGVWIPFGFGFCRLGFGLGFNVCHLGIGLGFSFHWLRFVFEIYIWIRFWFDSVCGVRDSIRLWFWFCMIWFSLWNSRIDSVVIRFVFNSIPFGRFWFASDSFPYCPLHIRQSGASECLSADAFSKPQWHGRCGGPSPSSFGKLNRLS